MAAKGAAAKDALFRFLAPYYVLNAAAISSFLAVRLLVLHSEGGNTGAFFEECDRRSILALVFTAAFKLWRASTVEAGLAGTFFYSQLLVVSLAFHMDGRVCAWYLLLFAALHLMCQQPADSRRDVVKKLTQRQLETFIADGAKTPAWLVEVYASWSPQCTQLAPLFAELSLSYSSPLLQFGRLDVARFSDFPDDHFIDTSMFSQQLPTYMLIQSGREVLRFPRLNEPDFLDTPLLYRVTKADLVKAFGLDKWLLASLQAAKSSKGARAQA